MANEADGKELLTILSAKTGFEEKVIKEVLDALPHCVAGWLLGYGQTEPGKHRGEQHGGLIYTLERKPESEGHGVAEGVTIPEHYALNIKAHKGFLDAMNEHFDVAVKNG